jgi:hypothetical protein
VKVEDLYQRFVLYAVVVLQVTLVPIVGFSLTYLLEVDQDNFSIAVRTELIYWIVIAGLLYGFLSLLLALFFGGYKPASVADRGGWMPILGLSRRSGDPELIDRTRLALQGSPYGKMARLVHEKTVGEGHDLIAVHGGLQLLAVPMQVLLIAVPLLIMEGVPDEVIKPDRAFELGMAGYMIALWMALRIQPVVSSGLVSYAAMFRSVLWRISRFSWILPVLLFWIIARAFLAASLGWLDVDVTQWHEVQLETVLLHAVVPDAVVPETAIIDFLVAISVLPMATFTTLSVLAGTHDMPDWMKGQESGLENLQMDLLEAPEAEEEPGATPIYDAAEPEESDTDEEESRMIDLPFRLFDD